MRKLTINNPNFYEEGDSIININTKRSLSINSFKNTWAQQDKIDKGLFSTVDFMNLNDITKTVNNQREAYRPFSSSNLQHTWEFGDLGVRNDILSTIKPK